MYRAIGTGWLVLLEGAPVEMHLCVDEELAAFLAKHALGAMMIVTVQAHHCEDSLFLSFHSRTHFAFPLKSTCLWSTKLRIVA